MHGMGWQGLRGVSRAGASVGDIARTSMEAGNSPDMIRQHYLELRTPEEGKAWFGVMPGGAAHVVPFRANAG